MAPDSPLGFTWEPSAIPALRRDDSVERAAARFRQALPHAVWEAAKFEDSPYTYPEVQTLLDGVTGSARVQHRGHQTMWRQTGAVLLLDLNRRGERPESPTHRPGKNA